jgi:hypothetical protein
MISLFCVGATSFAIQCWVHLLLGHQVDTLRFFNLGFSHKMSSRLGSTEQDSDVERRSNARDVEPLSWDDPNEKRNPVNWNIFLKTLHTFIPCALAFWM